MRNISLIFFGLPFILGYFFPHWVIGQKIVSISDTVDQHLFSFGEIEYLEDSTRKLTINQVTSPELTNKFRPSLSYSPTNTQRTSTYWYRIRIKNDKATRKSWVIEFFDQTIDHLEFYEPTDSNKFVVTIMGDEFNFFERETVHKNFVIKLSNANKNDNILTYYVKVFSKQKADMLIVLRSKNWLFQYALDEYFFFGIFYGMILVFTLYNLLMFIAVRERHYLYYILYLISIGLYEMSADGIGFQYLWPNIPKINNYASSLFIFGAAISAMAFSASVLNLRKENKPLFRIFIGIAFFRLLFLITSLFLIPEWINFRFVEIVPFLVIYYASIHSYFFKHYSPARFLVLAYSFVAFGTVHKVMQYYGIEWKPIGELSHYSLGFSFVIEMMLLSFAISDKIRILRLEKAEAQAKTIEQLHENHRLKDDLNQRLEEQVQEKTAELIKANKQLASQAEEIAEINKLLERDNVQLQHEVEEVKEARVLSKEVDFKEFSEMHPDDDSWMQYLAEIKWGDGYICRKCQHMSYGSGRSPHSRRCTKCGYDESVTAYTLLQNTRLPLNKALYMVFLIYNSKGTISSHKLSEKLGIRQSTCWSYSSRIKNRIKQRQKEGSIIKGHGGWSSIIFEN